MLKKVIALSAMCSFFGLAAMQLTAASKPCSSCEPTYNDCLARGSAPLWCEKNYYACLNTCT